MIDEDKVIDSILEILTLMNNYVPTQLAPANPQLPLIQQKLTTLKILRAASKERFRLALLDIASVTKKISDIQL